MANNYPSSIATTPGSSSTYPSHFVPIPSGNLAVAGSLAQGNGSLHSQIPPGSLQIHGEMRTQRPPIMAPVPSHPTSCTLQSANGDSSRVHPNMGRSTICQQTPISAKEGEMTSLVPLYSYDVSSSNLILPRGAIRAIEEASSPNTVSSRSSSTPVELKVSERPPSISFDAGPTKSEKIRKNKKVNSSTLPLPPASSSTASVPMTEGELAVAQLLGDRWPDALYQGWMRKRNKGKESTAKKRYLVLTTSCLEYYSDPFVRCRLRSSFPPARRPTNQYFGSYSLERES